ncbi:sulfatase-like hydrolase/transferase [Bradyrhizobium manausense]|uniref:sulfatase-like hydrolase/transferase n=1 Tax=Bradyrhizobium TaxID=374 RepID=UPI001BA65078|nr:MULTISPECIES: sulfatase-like hydrolase/transferase [Bradyrhizobium]MBR0825775.1 sulfatase-like hydrolase/transferase [Bradyrhizobium manausense]UVO31280.1 sulfatase-like hydrolase/transferase [Bradyrhizobium arachidis]
MASAPNPGPSAATAALASVAAIGIWRLLAVAAPQLAALALMVQTENDFGSRLGFILSWGMLNFFWLALLRRPALSGALSLTMVVVLVLLSRLKHDVVQMTVNFIDLMMIDRDTVAFLFTIFPNLRWSVIMAALVILPLMYSLWWLDPFRVRRLPALACKLACLAALVGYSISHPDEAWRGYYDDGYLSKFFRSGVTAVSDFMRYGFMESAAANGERLNMPLVDSCHAAGRRPNIIMVHDESSFDIRAADGIKVPPGYGDHFKSYDGRQRTFLAESNGGPSWFTEYNVLAGLSSRSFGRFAYFVTRIASGRVERGLPLALRRCGYDTMSLYPAYGAFMSARSFQVTAGIERFYDAKDLGAKDVEPDSFFYDKALQLMGERTPNKPLFSFIYLGANHFPWETRFRPELTPNWRAPGNVASIDEYLRRQAMSAEQYKAFIAGLKKKFPGEPFLIVRYGDHQPEFAPHILEPGLDEGALGKKLDAYDPRLYATYYAIDAINFEPVKSEAVMDTIDAAYLPLVIQEAAGVPLDPSFAVQKDIMLRCKGLFYSCKDGAEARRLNRLLIDAGFVKNL